MSYCLSVSLSAIQCVSNSCAISHWKDFRCHSVSRNVSVTGAKSLRVTGVNSFRIIFSSSSFFSPHWSHKYSSVGLLCADCHIHGTGIVRTYLTTPIQPGQNVPQHHHAETTSVVWTVKHSSAVKRIVPHHRGTKTTSVMCAVEHYPATKGNVYREIPVHIFMENVICVQFMSYVIILCMCYATCGSS